MNAEDLFIDDVTTLRICFEPDQYVSIAYLRGYEVDPWGVLHIDNDAGKTVSFHAYPSVQDAIVAATKIRNANAPIVVSWDTLNPLTEEILAMLIRKNHDYGRAWEKHGLDGIVVRLTDKCSRLDTLLKKDAQITDESTADTLRDIAGCCMLGLLWLRNKGEA